MQQALKSSSGAARAQNVATELPDQLDIPVDETPAALHPGSEGNDFRRLLVTSKAVEVFEIAMLAHATPPLKTRADRRRPLLAHPGARPETQLPLVQTRKPE
jgi:hypothetical protein